MCWETLFKSHINNIYKTLYIKCLILWIISPYLVDKFNDTRTVRYNTLRYRTGLTLFKCGISHLAMRFVLAAGPFRLWSQISFALTGLAARANHLFYLFRTVFRVPYMIRPWYESRVCSVSPSDFFWGARPCVRFTRALVVFVLYSETFRHWFVIIRLLSSKIHIRYSYAIFYSLFSHFRSEEHTSELQSPWMSR